jgi:hypothetical protein
LSEWVTGRFTARYTEFLSSRCSASYPALSSTILAAFSPIMMLGALVLPNSGVREA